MDINQCSDQDLLSMVLGKDQAVYLQGKSLSEVFGINCFGVRDQVIDPALLASYELVTRVLHEQVKKDKAFANPTHVKKYLTLKIGHLNNEEFHAIWLDNKNCVIELECLSTGTIDGAAVYPREVVRSAIKYNAAHVIFAHNHPSGDTEPSKSDFEITRRLKSALELIQVDVLDHVIVGDCLKTTYSMAEQGRL